MTSKYYRRVERSNGRLKSTYIGSMSDPMVQVLYRYDQLSRANRRAARRQHVADRDQLARIDYCLDGQFQQIYGLLRVWLRTQSRTISRDGSWQTKQLRQTRRETTPVNMTRDDFEEMVALAEAGNEQALKSLREIMASDRDEWFLFGDLQYHARVSLIDRLTRGQTIARESLLINLDEMRRTLLRGIDHCVRNHAVEHVVTCWLDMHSQTLIANEDSPTRSASDFHDGRLEKAQRRYQKALKFLLDLDKQLGFDETRVTDRDVCEVA